MEAMMALAILLFVSFGICQAVATPSVVVQDGSGSFRTINDALRAAPSYSREKVIIVIKKGIYYEQVTVGQEKTNIVLIGEGVENTVISGSKSVATGFGLQETATVGILGNGFMAQGITFKNTAGLNGRQAVALLTSANYVTFYQCRFMGYQDTLYAKYGIAFFRDCEIIGTVDFIFGDAASIFQNCIIRARQPLPEQYITITAQGRTTTSRGTGFIFQNCSVYTEELHQAKTKVQCYLGRPWKDFSRTVFMQSFMDAGVNPAGWIQWEMQARVHPYFAEYANRGPGAGTTRVQWSIIIKSPTEASQFTLRNFLQGGTWIPPAVPRYLDL
ncbi:OLC1v1030045C1 [Oldenlandia corymbosa var. corymbosa]|uniref:Pectinesterase n=1 Tax=Oldenlandia corymbosa var. corymbosa TaxID=529605 RepID=A0AAV1CGP4_OLDCO|nr:OLC1v1030045C1 [Oldenlandia corymbosa var. corymbosa]